MEKNEASGVLECERKAAFQRGRGREASLEKGLLSRDLNELREEACEALGKTHWPEGPTSTKTLTALACFRS